MAVQFLYPSRGNYSVENNNQMINVFDVLYLQYDSNFRSLNITAFCDLDTALDTIEYANAPGNPQAASGLFKWGTIHSVGFGITQYPTRCSFKLTSYGDNDNALGGEGFWVTSNADTSTTFSPSPSASGNAASTSSTSGVSTTTPSSASTSSTAMILGSASTSGSSTNSTSSSPASSTTGAASHASSSGLSTGAKAGIGVGVTAAVLIISALLFVIWCMRRKSQAEASNNTSYEKPELPSGTDRAVGPQAQSSGYPQTHDHGMDRASRADLGNAHSEVQPHTPGYQGTYNHEMDASNRAELGNPHLEVRPHELASY